MELPILINHDREKPIGRLRLEIPNAIIEFDDGHEPTRDEFFNIFGGVGAEILEYITPPSTTDEYKGGFRKFRIKKARILEFSQEVP